jgi:phasin family protein
MNKLTEQFASTNKASLENLQTVANTTLATIERLAALNLNTARAVLEDSSASIESLSSIKDPQSLIALQKSLAQPAIEKAFAYSRSVYEIISESSKGLTQLFEGHAEELNKNITTAIDNALKNAPAGSEVAVSAVKSAISAANSAYSNISKAAKQATEIAEANVAAANAATVKLVKKVA